jgi:hypothetical protein
MAVALVLCHPRFRHSAIMSEARAIAAEAYPATPGEDWPSLWSRLSARKLGERLAPAVGIPVYVFAVAHWNLMAGSLLYPLALMLLYAAGVAGAAAGHLLALRRQPTSPALGSLRARVLGSYLRPVDHRLWVAASLTSTAAGVIGVAAVVEGVTTVGWGMAVTGGAALALCLSARPVSAQILQSPARVTTEGGRVWAELLRSLVLRDVHQGFCLFALVGIFIATMPLLDEFSVPGLPGWLRASAGALMVASGCVMAVFGVVSWRVRTLRWTRSHALDEVVS